MGVCENACNIVLLRIFTILGHVYLLHCNLYGFATDFLFFKHIVFD